MESHTKTLLYEFVTNLYECLFMPRVLRKHMTEFIHENIHGIRKH
jgi:hypothetical protein